MAGDMVPLEVAVAHTYVSELKRRVFAAMREFPVSLMRLVVMHDECEDGGGGNGRGNGGGGDDEQFTGLDDARTLASYRLKDDACINLVMMSADNLPKFSKVRCFVARQI